MTFLNIYPIRTKSTDLQLRLPKSLVDAWQDTYDMKFSKAIPYWFQSDFSILLEDNIKTMITLVKKRFARLFPVLSIMEFLTDSEIFSLWVVEHLEEDLHKERKDFLYSENHSDNLENTLYSLVQQGIPLEDIQEYYIERFGVHYI